MTATMKKNAKSLAETIKDAIIEASNYECYEPANYDIESYSCGPGGFYNVYDPVDMLSGYTCDEDGNEYDYSVERQSGDLYKLTELYGYSIEGQMPQDFCDEVERILNEH